jgi:AraC-like DNA-binding protein
MIAEESPRMSATGLVGLLTRAVQRIATTSGDHHTALPELTLHRRNRPSQPVHCIYTLGMALTVQGSKHVLLGEKDLSYGPGQSLLTTIDLPVSYHITRATATDPYLGVMVKFDRSLITQVASNMEAVRPSKTAAFEPIWIQRLDAPVLDALHRLISLLDEPALIPQLAPLIQREMIVRLLTGPNASHLWHLVNAAGPTQQIAQAVTWIRQHFAEEMRVGKLAEHANMSPTTFRQHFRTITGMSPVQFQKLLRLHEARQLMLDQHMTAGSASALVGYESASQFNREYRRLFGAPPQHDIRKMLSR